MTRPRQCSVKQFAIPGQPWPTLSALYAGIMPADDGKSAWHLLLPIGTEFLFADVVWGEYGKAITGADSRFDGLANTLAMADAGSPLAQRIRTLPGDCYLPSRAELAMCQVILHCHFANAWYWSSTQCSADDAWCQEFNDGIQDINGAGAELHARAVCRLPIQLPKQRAVQ